MKAWEKYFRKVEPYVPGEQPKLAKMIKLNTNENPYPPSAKVKQTLQEMDWERLRMYPDPACEILVKELADTYHVDTDQVFVGVGSDDVLGMAFLTFFGSDKPILFRILPTLFMMCGQNCTRYHMRHLHWMIPSAL